MQPCWRCSRRRPAPRVPATAAAAASVTVLIGWAGLADTARCGAAALLVPPTNLASGRLPAPGVPHGCGHFRELGARGRGSSAPRPPARLALQKPEAPAPSFRPQPRPVAGGSPAAAATAAHAPTATSQLAFDGLEDLEEEEDVDDGPAVPSAALRQALAAAAASPRRLGDGLLKLERLWERYQEHGDDPDLGEEEVRELHEALTDDVPRCPAASTVAWTVRVLEEMGLDDDDLFKVCGQVLIDRADELEPQAVLDATCSYGNVYWVGDRLVDALAGAIRRQLADFTQGEIVKLANGLVRMGGTDDTRHAGLFFEMRQRVNLPMIDKFIREALNRDVQYYRQKSEETRAAISMFSEMRDGELKQKAEKHLQWEIETNQKRMLNRIKAEEALNPELEQAMGDSDLRGLFGQGGGSSGRSG